MCIFYASRLLHLTQLFVKGFFMKCLAIFFRQENVTQKYKTHPMKYYFTKQLLLDPIRSQYMRAISVTVCAPTCLEPDITRYY